MSMTQEEAINRIEDHMAVHHIGEYPHFKLKEALDFAISALRPVSRYLDDGWTLEVNRLCTDGTRNACSMLYAAAWRAARAMGYHKLITYILDSENGASLRAAGWKCVGQAGGLRWTGKRRPEVDLCPTQMKIKFEIDDGKRPPGERRTHDENDAQ